MSTLAKRRRKRRYGLFPFSQTASEPPFLETRRWTYRPSPNRFRARPVFDWLEDYLLLSASITGTVEVDQGGTSAISPGAAGIAGESVFLDLNNDHEDQDVTTVSAQSTAIEPAIGQLTGITDYYMSPLNIQSLQPDITDLKVAMNLTNNSPDPITVAVVSPVGLGVPDLPNLFQIAPGEHFDGSFDMNASTPITEANGLNVSGTFVPEQFFNDPPAHIDGTNPNGTWGLVFVGSASDISMLDLQSWSLTITTPDPTTVTDVDGNYSFTGLNPGTYQVETLPAPGDVQTFPAAAAGQTVKVADGQTASGIDFGIRPVSNLTTTTFYLSSPATSWGQDITINYTITNQGLAAAPAFSVAVLLSNNNTIVASDPLLETLHLSGLAAQSSITGQTTVLLPSTPPAGFGSTTQSIVGFLIDPAHALTHNDSADDANQGLGVDEAALAITPNEQVSTGSGIQQNPSIAVDPSNPNHIVVAYMDSALVDTGYDGIGVAVSMNNGATWSYSSVPLPNGFNQGAATPTVQFDGNGNVFIAFMAATYLGPQKPDLTYPDNTQVADGFESNNGIFVSESTNGGLNWAQPVTVVSHSFAGTPGTLGTTGPNGTEVPLEVDPNFAIDTYKTLPNGQPNPLYDDLYVTWVRIYPPGQFPGDPNSADGTDIMFAVSSNSSQQWQTLLQTQPAPGEPGNVQVSVIRDPAFGTNDQGPPGQGYVYYPQIAIGPQGDIYVSAFSGGYFTVFHSTDGGASFTPPNYNSSLGIIPSLAGLVKPTATLFNDAFRTLSVRDIVADPTHPGRVYIADANSELTQAGANIIFAYSDDYGQTWEIQFQVGSETTNFANLIPGQNDLYESVLNDDDSGNFTLFDTAQQYAQEVVAGQALPSLAIDAQGQLTAVWYDTRDDDLNQNLDVFGSVSNNGGQNWSDNFRLTDASFNPAAGDFTDPNGTTSDYLGDRIGLVAVNGIAYAVWTDTINGGQQIFLQEFSLNLAPAPPLGRFYPDGTAATATRLGKVTTQELIPELTVAPADDNWFTLQAGASGELEIVATATSGDPSDLQVELTDASGKVLPAIITQVVDASGAVTGSQIVFPSVAGQTYLVHLSGGLAKIGYSLVLQSLTADLGTSVEGNVAGRLTAGGQSLYRLETPVSGSLGLSFSPDGDVSGDLVVNVLDASGQTVLVSGIDGGSPANVPQTITLPVTAGEVVLIQVEGNNPQDYGDFTFTYTNFDQYQTPGNSALFLPTAGNPASVRVADLDGDSEPDILVSSVDTSDTLQVLAGNANGTFQASEEYQLGAGLSGFLNAGYRQIGVADFNDDGELDVAVPNFREGDVSVLLNNGDGGFQPGRAIDAVPSPDSLVTGDFVTGSNNTDIAVLQNFPQGNGTSQLAILIGRGDGTFEPAVSYSTVFANGAGPMVVGDFTGNGIDDIIVFSKNEAEAEMFLGNGNGTLQPGTVFTTGENTYAAEAVDLLGNGVLDLITTGTNGGAVYVQMGDGKGDFGSPISVPVMKPMAGEDVGVYGLTVVGFDSTISGSTPPASQPEVTGTPGIYATAQSRTGNGPGGLYFLPAVFNAQHQFTGFGAPELLVTLQSAGKITAFDDHGNTELVAADTGGVWVISDLPGSQNTDLSSSSLPVPANTTVNTARNLGSADHIVADQETIVTGFEDAYFTYNVPIEAVPGSGPEVVDFSAFFQDTSGAGLGMEVLDASGNVLNSGDRLRLVVPQGTVLTIHVFGEPSQTEGGAQGHGVFTLDIDVLPQLVSVRPLAPIPGGPVTGIVLTFQGDNLDLADAEDPANYSVVLLGPGGGVVPIGTNTPGQAIVYDPSTNVDVTGGLSYTTAVDQTVTLLFAKPLAPGSYEIELSPAIQSAPYSAAEASELAPGVRSFAGHPVVTVTDGIVTNGVNRIEANLFTASGTASMGSAVSASLFLTEIQGALLAILDQGLEASLDDSVITAALNNEVLAQYLPIYGAAGSGSISQSMPTFAIIWFDPVSISLQSPQGLNLSYNLSSNALSDGIGSSFVSVGSNVEMIVMENAAGTFNLDVSNVAATSQGGAILMSSSGFSTEDFTAGLQSGETGFSFSLASESGSSPGTGPSGGGSPGTTSESASANGLSTNALASNIALLVGLTTFEEGAGADFSTGPSEVSASAGPGGATGAGQPLLPSRGLNSSNDPAEQADQLNSLESFQSVVQAVKKVLSRLGDVMDALGRQSPAAFLRQLSDILDKLNIAPLLIPAINRGGRLRNVKDANPAQGAIAPGAASAPVPGAVGIDMTLWDHGISGLLTDHAPAGAERNQSELGALSAAAFLAAGLAGCDLNGRRPLRSPWARRPRRRHGGGASTNRKRLRFPF